MVHEKCDEADDRESLTEGDHPEHLGGQAINDQAGHPQYSPHDA